MFYAVFKQLCDARGISPTRASEEIGFSKGSVSYWKKKFVEGVDAKPDSYTAEKIADFFGVSVDTLLGRSQPAPPDTPAQPAQPADADAVTPEQLATLDPATRRIAELFGSLPEAERQEALHYIEYIIARSKGEGGEPDA